MKRQPSVLKALSTAHEKRIEELETQAHTSVPFQIAQVQDTISRRDFTGFSEHARLQPREDVPAVLGYREEGRLVSKPVGLKSS